MSKAARIAKVSAKGGFNLFIGVSLSTTISALFVVILGTLLTKDEVGLYTVAFVSPSLIGLFKDWGINAALVKYIAQYRSEGKTNEIKKVLASALIFSSSIGIILSVISFSLAGFLATTLFYQSGRDPYLTTAIIQIASVTILANSLILASQSVFIGFERMEFQSLTLICQSILKVFITIPLIFLGYRTLGAVLGQVMATLIISALAVIIFCFIFYRKIYRSENSGLEISRTFKMMLRYGLPLSVSSILSGFLAQFYSFLMVIYCSDSMIGNYTMALNFSMLISFFTTPITTVLFPAFSKLDSEKEMGTLRNVFQSSVKYATLLTVPVTLFIMVLSKPLVFTLFAGKFGDAPLFLTLISISYLYTGLGNLSVGNFLNSQGRTKVTMKLTLITMGVGLPLSLTLIPAFGILGLIFTTLLAVIPSLAVGLWWAKKNFRVAVDWTSTTKILLASATATAITYVTIYPLTVQDWIKLVLGGTIFLAVYFIVAPAIRAIDESDVKNLREMVSALGPLSYLFNLPLNIIEKILNIFNF